MDRGTHLVSEVRLCSGTYKPNCADHPAVEVFCQTVVLNSVAYVWIDGVNFESPLLLPVQSLHNFRHLGTLRTYLEDERHIELGELFDELIDLCMATNVSATLLIRACEIMHAEGCSAEQAVVTARQWGVLLNDLDQTERAAYQFVESGAHLH